MVMNVLLLNSAKRKEIYRRIYRCNLFYLLIIVIIMISRCILTLCVNRMIFVCVCGVIRSSSSVKFAWWNDYCCLRYPINHHTIPQRSMPWSYCILFATIKTLKINTMRFNFMHNIRMHICTLIESEFMNQKFPFQMLFTSFLLTFSKMRQCKRYEFRNIKNIRESIYSIETRNSLYFFIEIDLFWMIKFLTRVPCSWRVHRFTNITKTFRIFLLTHRIKMMNWTHLSRMATMIVLGTSYSIGRFIINQHLLIFFSSFDFIGSNENI